MHKVTLKEVSYLLHDMHVYTCVYNNIVLLVCMRLSLLSPVVVISGRRETLAIKENPSYWMESDGGSEKGFDHTYESINYIPS